MTNSDNLHGTFNKRTQILTQKVGHPSPLKQFTNIEEAKNFFYFDAALAVFDECCTELQWAIVDETKLKFTMAFGTKGGNILEADDWAGQYNSRKAALMANGAWSKRPATIEHVDSHLF